MNLTKDGPTLSLVVTYLFSISSKVSILIYAYSEVAKNISAAQRIKEYEDNKTFEDEFEKPRVEDIYENWPQNGKIEFSRISVKYRKKLPLVIKNFSAVINPKEKVAIVGRTGSGKSTLLLTLMRILELSETDENEKKIFKGKIIIDGVDISEMGLHELRKKLTIIPQDPQLLDGTLAFNIDPNNLYTDEEDKNLKKMPSLGHNF